MNGLGYIGLYPMNLQVRVVFFFATAAGPLLAQGPPANNITVTMYNPPGVLIWNAVTTVTERGLGWYYKTYTPTMEGIFIVEYQIAASSLYYGLCFRVTDMGIAI